jgi:hypothetical protein
MKKLLSTVVVSLALASCTQSSKKPDTTAAASAQLKAPDQRASIDAGPAEPLDAGDEPAVDAGELLADAGSEASVDAGVAEREPEVPTDHAAEPVPAKKI